jgi:hypothetical protein
MAVHAPLYRASTRIFGAASYHRRDQVRLISSQGNLIVHTGANGVAFFRIHCM